MRVPCRLALTLVVAAASCTGPGQPTSRDSTAGPTASPNEVVVSSPPPFSPPPPNPLEQAVIGAFQALGIEARSTELQYNTASMAGEWRGSEVLVMARPENHPGLKLRPKSRSEIAGVTVAFGRIQTFGAAYEFNCRETIYQVTTLRGPKDTLPHFLERFIPELPC